VVEQLIVDDVARQSGTMHLTQSQVEDALVETRRHGLARAIGIPIPGINAFCAPVFDSAGNLVLGITAMGPESTFDSDWNGKVSAPLRACALEVSRRLGYLEAA